MNRKYSQENILRQGRSFPFCGLRPDAAFLLHSCAHTQRSFVELRNDALFVQLNRVRLPRDAPKNTIAPRPFPQGRTQKHYRAASCYPGTHLNLVCTASPRRSPVTALRLGRTQ